MRRRSIDMLRSWLQVLVRVRGTPILHLRLGRTMYVHLL
jgi:hypothetical protein